MTKIIRTKTKAYGGITAKEKALMDKHSQLWISRAMRTAPIEPDKIIPAIEGIYDVAGLKKPRVVIVPSPLIMVFAYGASAAIWYARKNPKKTTDAATDAATLVVGNPLGDHGPAGVGDRDAHTGHGLLLATRGGRVLHADLQDLLLGVGHVAEQREERACRDEHPERPAEC